MKLKVRNYNFKEDYGDPNKKLLGFVSQELETVFPSLAPTVDAIDAVLDENGKEQRPIIIHRSSVGAIETKKAQPEKKLVKTSILIPILVKSTQELNNNQIQSTNELKLEIQELNKKIKVLEGKI